MSDIYETTIDDYAATIGALAANTAGTAYDVVITDGENLADSLLGGYIKSTARFVNIQFSDVTLTGVTSLADSLGGTSANQYLVECDLSAIDCTVILDTARMFQYCTGLTKVTLPNFVSVTSADSMFKNCTALTTVDVSKMTILQNAFSMFEGCTSLMEATVSESINNAGRMFYGCTALTTVKNFKWDVSEMPDTTESTSATNAMPNCFKNCTSLAHIYYFSDDDSTVQTDCNEWRLYTKSGTSLKSYDTEGTEQTSETLEENAVVPVGKTLGLLFDTQTIDHTNIIEKPYLYAKSDGSLFDASGENFALLAKDPEKAVTNIEHFAKISASKKLVIPLAEPSTDDLTNGCMWIE